MGHQVLKEVAIYLMIVSFFITGNGFFVDDLTIYWYYPVYLIVLACGVIFYHKINLNLAVFTFLLWVFAPITTYYEVDAVIKQLVNVSFSLIALYYVFVLADFDLSNLVQKYVVVSKIVVVIGFVQVLMFLFDKGQLYLSVFQFLKDSNITFRFQSVCQEPSYAGYVLAPVAFMSFHRIFYGSSEFLNRRWAFMIIGAYVLTFSLVAYVGIVLMVLMLYFKNFSYQRLYLFGVLLAGIAFFSVFSYKNIPLLRVRIDDTFFAYAGGITNYDIYTKVNLSTYAILSNLYVTTSTVAEHPMTGTGLGTYSIAYDHYLPARMKAFSTINSGEGSSMGFRLLTETGLLGFGLFLYFLYKFRIKGQPYESPAMDLLWMMNTGIFVMTVLLLIRHGHYTTQGRLFFFLFYYFAYRAYVEKEKEMLSTNSPS